MSENDKINARCPLCGGDFVVAGETGKATCPHCGQEISAMQAVKYYQSVNESPEMAKEAHGDDYHKVMLLISECHDLCVGEKYDEAEKKAEAALSMTETDYRAYMAMVEVKTKLYTDLKDESHTEYLNKAIAVADSDGRAEIKRIYKPYYEKRRFSADELEKYNEENRKDKKQKLEKLLKSMIPAFLASDKRAIAYLVLFPLTLLLGIALMVLTFVLDIAWLSIIGVVLTIAGYVFFRLWFNSKESSKAFNALLDLYDCLDGVTLDDENAVEIYKAMLDIAERFSDRMPLPSMTDAYDKLITIIINADNEKVNDFIKDNKFFGKMVEVEE